MKNKITKYGFTLIELIVVITILSILGTIGFISFQGYSRDARDSVRINDISSITRALEFFMAGNGFYPEPQNFIEIENNGTLLWKQGIIGEKTRVNLRSLSKAPKDPLTDDFYTYSVTSLKNEYSIGGVLEGGTETSYIPFSKTVSAGDKKKAIVKGYYNGVILKSNSSTDIEIVATPSIITNNITRTEFSDILLNKSLVYNGYSNLPSSYSGSFQLDGGFDYTNSGNLMYKGKLEDLSDEFAATKFISNIKKSYSGTILGNRQKIKQIIEVDGLNIQKVMNIANSYIEKGPEFIIKDENDQVKAPLTYIPGLSIIYGIEKLNSNYTGPCLRLRRPSDNSEKDFYFGSDKKLDENSISSWLNGETGRVTKWYDQGVKGINLIQPTQSKQPFLNNDYRINIPEGKRLYAKDRPEFKIVEGKSLYVKYQLNDLASKNRAIISTREGESGLIVYKTSANKIQNWLKSSCWGCWNIMQIGSANTDPSYFFINFSPNFSRKVIYNGVEVNGNFVSNLTDNDDLYLGGINTSNSYPTNAIYDYVIILDPSNNDDYEFLKNFLIPKLF